MKRLNHRLYRSECISEERVFADYALKKQSTSEIFRDIFVRAHSRWSNLERRSARVYRI